MGAGAPAITALIVAALLPPWLLRAVLVVHSGARPAAADLRGLLADAGIGLLVAALLLVVARRSRWVGLPLIALWSFLCYGNYEHVRVLGGNAALVYAEYLIDPTFLFGSALSASAPILLVATIAIPLALTWFGSRGGGARRHGPSVVLATAAGTLLLHLLWPAQPAALPWRQDNFVWENLRSPIVAIGGAESGDPRIAAGDLDGEPLIPLQQRDRNVLLIILEGLSGAYVEASASANDREAAYDLPHLSRLAENNIFAGTFITMQRQTNRGEYALLCGDYPKLLSEQPKMSELIALPEVRCLPAALREGGYATAYLQAAPLSFMMKDRFLPHIGYDRVLGEEAFDRARVRNRWGVDDRSLFERGLAMVQELRAGGQPWFLTLLTVGTHHPFNVPVEYTGAAGTSDEERAFTYQDEALGEFIAALGESGVLNESLVLIVSDESAGIARGVDDLTRLLTQAWGYLAAITPSGERLRLDAPILQADIPLSVLDYLGLGDAGERFAGRSLFRRYNAPRPVGFGNTFLRSVGSFDGSGRLVVCREDLTGCLAYRTAEGRPFAPGIEPTGRAAGTEVGFLRGLIARSRIAPPAGVSAPTPMGSQDAVVLDLIAAPSFAVREGIYGPQLVAGGQSLTIGASTRLEVALDITVAGTKGQVVLTHELSANGRTGRRSLHREESPPLRPGERFRLRYHYVAGDGFPGVDCDLLVTAIDGEGLSLNIGGATLRAAPAPEVGNEDPPFGLDLREIIYSE
jgi:hypothetical protein